MNKLNEFDLKRCISILPKNLKDIMLKPQWINKIFIGGGYIRSIVTNEKINDIDLFVNSKESAKQLSFELADKISNIIETENAFTIKGRIDIQIIHRWVFEKIEDVSNSFDFTCCCAVISYNNSWDSYCDSNYYQDLAAKRLVYRYPSRNEDAGGSMLRVLKYYQKGFRIPLDSLGGVIARLLKDYNVNKTPLSDEKAVGKIITGLLREVDPNIDPTHQSHLPSNS